MPSLGLSLVGSPFVRSGFFMMLSGLSFSVANIIFARTMEIESYGLLSLSVAILAFAAPLGMLGADGIVNRYKTTPDWRLFGRVLLSSALVAIVAVSFSAAVYGLEGPIVSLLYVLIVALALTQFAAAYLQSQLKLVMSIVFGGSLNFMLLAVSLVALVYRVQSPFVALAVLALAQCGIAALAIGQVIRLRGHVRGAYTFDWREALAIVFMTSSGIMLVQLERFLTPRLLTIEDLATLGVVLAIVGPPFRLLQLTSGHVLLPVLRASRDRRETSSLIARQSIVLVLIIVPLCGAIWFSRPLLQQFFLADRYVLSSDLLLAVLIAGTVKALSGIARAGDTALLSRRAMWLSGAVTWFGILISAGAALHLSTSGLVGVVYAVSLGWMIRIFASAFLIRRQLGMVAASGH